MFYFYVFNFRFLAPEPTGVIIAGRFSSFVLYTGVCDIHLFEFESYVVCIEETRRMFQHAEIKPPMINELNRFATTSKVYPAEVRAAN